MTDDTSPHPEVVSPAMTDPHRRAVRGLVPGAYDTGEGGRRVMVGRVSWLGVIWGG
ncbi:hypothetical protein [Ornithinimicrobium sp. W1665]|uniref:hypothetical protein n=1 Tax=Ornithinimicrobium sp. W1665 TaxID=3416666 RepID=UPI003CE9F777